MQKTTNSVIREQRYLFPDADQNVLVSIKVPATIARLLNEMDMKSEYGNYTTLRMILTKNVFSAIDDIFDDIPGNIRDFDDFFMGFLDLISSYNKEYLTPETYLLLSIFHNILKEANDVISGYGDQEGGNHE